MSWPTPTRQDHQKFCEIEGWEPVRTARGRTGTHHLTYELALPDGRILRTRISHPPDRSTYGPGIWSHILRDQLDVTEDVFWKCVRDGVKPARGRPELPAAEPIPAEVVHLLITRVGLTEPDVARMTKDEAITRLNQYWAGE
ncbi:hypothetical protein ABZS66_22885 [Dactylosporangium sp. NPDC005572]|uniref:hypothetical protein n=1 Tax=Dactylosporangium sp. NPDC005572 TaxID=3156889 RepID=UPI0033A2C545